ncbi:MULTISPECIES: tripartite tricarboxylate transporter substrate binding protein [unclassified Mesorhizobium]|uniref:Bug family tripartite tricarboxylate transporter substrate binding protein n=1 Tax=unclassified Mesorhizobium TaxID=325217 RepID=UPI0015E32C45|nr:MULTISPECIES: tripartite tricarboxylate transporter substrate binding protein [unclassified Mesorhizobium]
MSAVAVCAEGFPERQITIVVAAPAGGPTDTFGRIIAESLGKTFNQRVLVENVVGAGGLVGSRHVASSAPDGYTLLLYNTALTSLPAFLKAAKDFDPSTALTPIGLINEAPFVLVSRVDFPSSGPGDLIARLRDDPASIRMGHGGFGGGAHICGLLLARALKAQPNFVAYRGAAAVMTDILGGHIDLFCAQTADAINNINSKSVKGFWVTGPARLNQLADLPTIAEAGISGADISAWHGLFAPAGTPAETVKVINSALAKTLQDPAVLSRFESLGATPVAVDRRSPEALGKHVKAELARWKDLVAELSVEQE